MTPLTITISLLPAFLAAGIVWYGWGVAENVLAIRSSRDRESDSDETEDGEETETPE